MQVRTICQLALFLGVCAVLAAIGRAEEPQILPASEAMFEGNVVHEGTVDGGVVYEGYDDSYGDEGSYGVRRRNELGLFQNYWVPPVNRYGAQMYVSPRWTPAYVGHTYITYPPFAPHHYLWRHRGKWRNGFRKARVTYR